MRFKPAQLVVAFLSVAALVRRLAATHSRIRLPLITATAFVGAMCDELRGAFWYQRLQEHVPPHALSRVSSSDWLGSWLFSRSGTSWWGRRRGDRLRRTLLIAVGWTILRVSRSC